ncbi:MAG: MBL fold metallo-hydrolase [Desulfosarcinaceae bacterium]|nr:MBL fold metallo-hydrolase [Desulfosarcinaceae bacterium]
MLKALIHPVDSDLFLIELRPPLPGFEAFISAWLVKGGTTYLVDVGPAVTAPHLLMALDELGVQHLDAIYLTHIHIDHAGAIGQIAEAFPEAPIVVHPKGIDHLVDPARLWEGTLKTLADTARAYGPYLPVSRARCVPAEGDLPGNLAAIATPGHAPHHISYLGAVGLFVGEAGGVRLDLPNGDTYLRPATPPRFIADIYLSSIAAVEALHPRRLLYGHYGATEDVRFLTRHADQIRRWMEVVATVWERNERTADGGVVDRCLAQLLASDEDLRGLGCLNAQAQTREHGFLRNSIRGMLGELTSRLGS